MPDAYQETYAKLRPLIYPRLFCQNLTKFPGTHRQYEATASPADRKESHYGWFAEHWNADKAVTVVEDVIDDGGRARWMDCRMTFGTEQVLHLHVVARGDYDTGMFAYNIIRRGECYGLKIVGSVKSQPSLNVLAIYEKWTSSHMVNYASRSVTLRRNINTREPPDWRLLVDGAGLAGMAVSRGRSVERSRLAWFSNRLPPCWVWLSNDVLAGRGLAVAWLKRGVSAKQGPGIRRLAAPTGRHGSGTRPPGSPGR